MSSAKSSSMVAPRGYDGPGEPSTGPLAACVALWPLAMAAETGNVDSAPDRPLPARLHDRWPETLRPVGGAGGFLKTFLKTFQPPELLLAASSASGGPIITGSWVCVSPSQAESREFKSRFPLHVRPRISGPFSFGGLTQVASQRPWSHQQVASLGCRTGRNRGSGCGAGGEEPRWWGLRDRRARRRSGVGWSCSGCLTSPVWLGDSQLPDLIASKGSKAREMEQCGPFRRANRREARAGERTASFSGLAE